MLRPGQPRCAYSCIRAFEKRSAGLLVGVAQMDALVARSEEELVRFRAAPLPAMAARLAPAAQCGALIDAMREANTAKVPVVEGPLGRGVRRR